MNIFRNTCCVALASTWLFSYGQEVKDTTSVVSKTKAIKDTVSITGVGDIMMGSNYGNGMLPPDDGAGLMKEVEGMLNDSDVTFGNLEGVIMDSGGTPKTCRDPKVCYVFRTPVKYVDNLKRAGFDMMSIANNHAGDFGD